MPWNWPITEIYPLRVLPADNSNLGLCAPDQLNAAMRYSDADKVLLRPV
jgi:hypothetical protein